VEHVTVMFLQDHTRVDLVIDARADAHGFEIMLAPGWRDSVMSAHEFAVDTMLDAWRRVSACIPCQCSECVEYAHRYELPAALVEC